ncbi:proline--tRNA ligase [Methylocapsa palsarum]|uniref:Proline--tRNA ligase n=1 Tax=Methylocapsa palsarum TaxID=1612308 RepID=A0A1I4BS33_9HYPH|nr:proline--tRNA ligase [Methylocapsa palsarum]SFK71618.1 prolyl-tRNA synthetase [Methylocapsa palsarum]
MRLSRYFLPILRETPKEAEIVSHRLMLRAGMIRQEASGIYAWLPLGLRVLQKVGQIVREEMDRAGAIELLMPTLQLADLWRETGRYEAYGPEMLRIVDRHKRELLYGPTNEDMITEIFRAYIRSYRDLPKILYHIQWKFRDEQRPRFGVMRGREFLMKDAYSFDVDEASSRLSYNRMFVSYLRIFARMGLRAIPMRAETGPIGGDLSHEFIILAQTGESGVFCHADVLNLPVPGEDIDYDADLTPVIEAWTRLYAATEDVHDAARFERETPEDKRIHTRGIEVGQVFYFGDKYSKPMQALIAGPDGVERPFQGGSYGVGVSRLVGALIEANHDEAGIIWPEAVAPFRIGLANLKVGDGATDAACAELYAAFQKAGVDVLYDDTDERPGAKFAKLDLIGLPYQVIVGPKGLAEGKVEVKTRATGDRQSYPLAEAVARLTEA